MNILSELKLRNISINECAKKTGIRYGALYPIVHGKVSLEKCEYGTLKKLADFLGCEIEDFFTANEDFSVYWGDEKTADVHFEENHAVVTRYTTNPAKQIFYKDEIPLFEIGGIMESRCWDRNRDNLEKYLFKLGLTEFNPYKICRKTHGVMFQDRIWFKYKGEQLTWEDVRWR